MTPQTYVAGWMGFGLAGPDRSLATAPLHGLVLCLAFAETVRLVLDRTGLQSLSPKHRQQGK
jgi:hypothetical protein